MNHEKTILRQRVRRKHRVRKSLRGTAEKPRMSIFRSHKHLYCQLIDDAAGRTLCSASTRDKSLSDQVTYGGNAEAAKLIGQEIAKRAQQAGIHRACFDRGPYRYHGRVAAVADAAREAGLQL